MQHLTSMIVSHLDIECITVNEPKQIRHFMFTEIDCWEEISNHQCMRPNLDIAAFVMRRHKSRQEIVSPYLPRTVRRCADPQTI